VDAEANFKSSGSQRGQGTQASSWKHPIFIASMAGVVIGLGLGVGSTTGFIIKNADAETEYDKRMSELIPGQQMCNPNLASDPQCSRLNDATATRNMLTRLAIAGYALGLAGGTGLVIWKFISKPKDSDNHMKAQVMVSPGGLTVVGAF
jgi:hypothetical protein